MGIFPSACGRWHFWLAWRWRSSFMNGFHDGANSISTIVATGAPSRRARRYCLQRPSTSLPYGCSSSAWRPPSARARWTRAVDHFIIFGARPWVPGLENIITWYYGIPSSFARPAGGLVGATVAWHGLAPIVGRLWQDPVVHRAAPGLLHRRHLDGAGGLDLSQTTAPSGQRAGFATASSLPRAYSLGAWRAMTRKRPSASSGYCLLPPVLPRPMWPRCQPGWCMPATAPLPGYLPGGWRIVKPWAARSRDSIRSVVRAPPWRRHQPGLATLGGIPVSTTHHHRCHRGRGHGAGRKGRSVGADLQPGRCWVLTIPASGLIAAAFWYVGTEFRAARKRNGVTMLNNVMPQRGTFSTC